MSLIYMIMSTTQSSSVWIFITQKAKYMYVHVCKMCEKLKSFTVCVVLAIVAAQYLFLSVGLGLGQACRVWNDIDSERTS